MKQEKKHRLFMALSYCVNKTQLQKAIIASGATKFALIIHDRDCNEDGERKKSHAHIILRYANARTISAVANHLEILPQFVEPVKREREALLYLTHQDQPHKAQYNLSEIIKSGYNDSIWTAAHRSEEESVLTVLDLIQDPNIKTYADLIRAAVKAGCWSELRRGGILITKAFDEQRELRKDTKDTNSLKS